MQMKAIVDHLMILVGCANDKNTDGRNPGSVRARGFQTHPSRHDGHLTEHPRIRTLSRPGETQPRKKGLLKTAGNVDPEKLIPMESDDFQNL